MDSTTVQSGIPDIEIVRSNGCPDTCTADAKTCIVSAPHIMKAKLRPRNVNLKSPKSPYRWQCDPVQSGQVEEDPTTITLEANGGRDHLTPEFNDFVNKVDLIGLDDTAFISTESTQEPDTFKFGMYGGRVKANPLKYLATVLRTKLLGHYEPRNLLELATEIHNEAKNKHNTTLRRIYDVVNVLEAAGLVERINTSFPSKKILKGFLSGAGCSSSGKFRVASGQPTSGYSTAQGKRSSTRGSSIRWLGRDSQRHPATDEQMRQKFQEERQAATERITNKDAELLALTEQLRLTTALLQDNKRKALRQRTLVLRPRTPPPEDHTFHLAFDQEETQTSTSNGGSGGSTRSPLTSQESVSTVTTQDELLSWFESIDELNSPSRIEDHPQSTAKRKRPRSTADGPQPPLAPKVAANDGVKGLYIPFGLIRTSRDTNVEILLDVQYSDEVHLSLDDEYEFCDHVDLLSYMMDPVLEEPQQIPADCPTRY